MSDGLAKFRADLTEWQELTLDGACGCLPTGEKGPKSVWHGDCFRMSSGSSLITARRLTNLGPPEERRHAPFPRSSVDSGACAAASLR